MATGLGLMFDANGNEVDVDTYWNGDPTYCEQVWIMRGGEKTAAVLVMYGDDEFFLLDDHGQGWAKVTNGFGSPYYGHQNVWPDGNSNRVWNRA